MFHPGCGPSVFLYMIICVVHLIFCEIFVSEIIYFILSTKFTAFTFAQKKSFCPRKENNGHRPLNEAIWP